MDTNSIMDVVGAFVLAFRIVVFCIAWAAAFDVALIVLGFGAFALSYPDIRSKTRYGKEDAVFLFVLGVILAMTWVVGFVFLELIRGLPGYSFGVMG